MRFLRTLKQKNQSVKECLAQAEMHFPKICSQFWPLWFIFELLSHNTYYFPPQQKHKESLSTFSRNRPFQWLFKCSWNLKFSCRAFQALKVYWRNTILIFNKVPEWYTCKPLEYSTAWWSCPVILTRSDGCQQKMLHSIHLWCDR